MHDITTLGGLLDARGLEIGQVLAGERQHGGRVLRLECDEVGSRGLVTVCRAPEREVGDGTEVDGGFDRLVSGAILAETDGIVGGDPDDLVARQCGETHGTGGVGDEVQEGGNEGDDTAVGRDTVGNGCHTVFTDTIANVRALVRTKASVLGLEIDHGLRPGQVATRKIGRATEQVRDEGGDGSKDDFRQLARSLGGIGGLVSGEFGFPARGGLAGDTTAEFSVLGRVLLLVGGQKGIPLGFELGASLSNLSPG